MLVDNHVQHQPYFNSSSASSSSSSYPDFTADFSDIFHTELFTSTANSAPPPTSHSPAPLSTSSGSRESSPSSPFNHNLLTPPPSALPSSFPEVQDGSNADNSDFFNLFDDDMKTVDSLSMTSSAPYDFLGVGSFGSGMDNSSMGGYSLGMGNIDFPMSMGMGVNMMGMDMGMDISPNSHSMQTEAAPIGIDPQLVGTPSTTQSEEEDARAREADDEESNAGRSLAVDLKRDSKEKDSKEHEKQKEPEREKLTLTIAPVKVGGHGKARKGTVQSGGVVKKSSSTPSASSAKNKENNNNQNHVTISSTSSAPSPFKKASGSSDNGDAEDDDDDLPQDWRPSPEVFAKMSSKEKRQLRNKISARNFRVRRKEYISTLEGDIAERDRLLDAIRSELGSTQSENFALRQEIATLKRTLLDGRGPESLPLLNLPPPAPLPAQSAAATLALTSPSPSPAPTNINNSNPTSTLLTPNTQKDLPTSPRLGQSTRTPFWGGVGMGLGGGITPVHTALLPEVQVQVPAVKKLQENINPALNFNYGGFGTGFQPGSGIGKLGFDGFADMNMFTMKSLDAYRMQLWGRMAAQQQQMHRQERENASNLNHNGSANGLTGLAASMQPHFFTSKRGIPFASNTNTLSSLLSGKHHPTPAGAYPSPPASPKIGFSKEKEAKETREREKEREAVMVTALASQTLLKKMGAAFWDAFSGSSSSSSAFASSSGKNWDADKVRKVLEGRAVVRVVDVEGPVAGKASTEVHASVPRKTESKEMSKGEKCCSSCMTGVSDILEESMRSLSLGKKM